MAFRVGARPGWKTPNKISLPDLSGDDMERVASARVDVLGFLKQNKTKRRPIDQDENAAAKNAKNAKPEKKPKVVSLVECESAAKADVPKSENESAAKADEPKSENAAKADVPKSENAAKVG